MKKILVTGSSGLIGSTLVPLLRASGYSLCMLDIRGSSEETNPINILDSNALLRIVEGCDGIIHLAAVSRVIWGEENPELCHEVNVDGTRNIIDACLALQKKPWLIYASSREVYGQQEVFPVSEDCEVRPHNHYARSKLQAENLVNGARLRGLKSAVLRFSNVFGGTCDYSERVVPAFCHNALHELPLFVNGQDSLLDFTYVHDVVRGILGVVKLISEGATSLPAIHFTTGKATSLLSLANLVKIVAGSNSPIIIRPKDSIYPAKFYGDNRRAKELLGWEPEYDVQRGVQAYIEKLKNNEAILYPSITVSSNENTKGDTRLSA